MACAFGPILLLVGLVVAVGSLAWGRGKRPTAEPGQLLVCGKCQYPVRGISTFLCPECGADLREVGILPPGRKSVWGQAMLAFVWTFVVAVIASVSARVVLSSVPRLTTSVVTVGFSPQSSMLGQIEVQASVTDSTGRSFGTSSRSSSNNGVYSGTVTLSAISPNSRPDRVTIRINLPQSPATQIMDVNPKTMGYWHYDAAGNVIEKKSGFDIDAVKAWLKGLNVNGSGPLFDSEVQELAATVSSLANGQGTIKFSALRSPRISSTSSTRVAQWPSFALLAFWVVVYFAGLWWIIKRWRREPEGAAPRTDNIP